MIHHFYSSVDGMSTVTSSFSTRARRKLVDRICDTAAYHSHNRYVPDKSRVLSFYKCL